MKLQKSAPKRDAAYTYRSQSSIIRRFVSHVTSWMRVTLWSADLRQIGRIGSLGPRTEPTKHKNAPRPPTVCDVRQCCVTTTWDFGSMRLARPLRLYSAIVGELRAGPIGFPGTGAPCSIRQNSITRQTTHNDRLSTTSQRILHTLVYL